MTLEVRYWFLRQLVNAEERGGGEEDAQQHLELLVLLHERVDLLDQVGSLLHQRSLMIRLGEGHLENDVVLLLKPLELLPHHDRVGGDHLPPCHTSLPLPAIGCDLFAQLPHALVLACREVVGREARPGLAGFLSQLPLAVSFFEMLAAVS